LLHLLPLIAFFPLAALAADSAPGIPVGTYLQATLALLLIVGLLLGATWAARKVSGGRLFGQGNMRVISGIALGPKERIVLVEVADSWLVVGIVPGQIRTLHTLPKGEYEMPAGQSTPPAFSEWLKAARERNKDAA